MNPSAIPQAIRLYKHPKEMSWICQSDTPLAKEITALLRLCTSTENLRSYSKKIQVEPEELEKILHNFIEKVLLNRNNPPERILGLGDNADADLRKLHYHLLLEIYQPDKKLDFKPAYQATRIIEAYQNLPPQKNMDEFKNIRISRVPVKNTYRETNHTEQQLSNLKNTLLIVLAITVISTVWLSSYLYSPTEQETFSQNSTPLNSPYENQTQATEKNTVNQFSKARQTSGITDNNQTQLHSLLSSVEEAYEQGNATKIQLFLNTPEIKEQSDEEVFKKLKNLFKITSKRKMLLYDFEWKILSGKIYGKGKFLSRYHLNQADQWLTREGVASVKISNINNKLEVISLQLDNNIDQ